MARKRRGPRDGPDFSFDDDESGGFDLLDEWEEVVGRLSGETDDWPDLDELERDAEEDDPDGDEDDD